MNTEVVTSPAAVVGKFSSEFVGVYRRVSQIVRTLIFVFIKSRLKLLLRRGIKTPTYRKPTQGKLERSALTTRAVIPDTLAILAKNELQVSYRDLFVRRAPRNWRDHS